MLFAKPLATSFAPIAIKRIFQKTSARTLVQFKKYYYIHPLDEQSSLVSFSKNPQNISIGAFDHKDFKFEDLTTENADDKIRLSDDLFRGNQKFLDKLWKFFSENVYDDYSYQLEAGDHRNGFMPVYDFRKIPEYGRRSEVDDVFGWVRVDGDDKMVKGTFEPNKMYRAYTKTDGLPKLTDFTLERIEEITKP